MIEEGHGVELTEEAIVFKHFVGYVLTAKLNLADPTEMIQTKVFAMHFCGCRSECLDDPMEHLGRGIADADNAGIRMLGDRLRDEPGGIGEIDQPCVRRQPMPRAAPVRRRWAPFAEP